LSIGQGDLLATPLQMACAYTVFANDGKIVMPHVVMIDDYTYHTTDISQAAIAIIKEMLAGVVASGTGRLAHLDDYVVSGKTGTVQNPHGEDHAIFIGYGPGNTPDILVCLVVENAGHGGSVAAPVVGKIIRTFLNSTKLTHYAEEN